MLKEYEPVKNCESRGKKRSIRMIGRRDEEVFVVERWARRMRSASTRAVCSARLDCELRKDLFAGLADTSRPDLFKKREELIIWGKTLD